MEKKNLGFGFMRVPIIPKKGANWTKGNLDYNYDVTCEMVDYFMAHGFNTFHTAWAYPNNEAFFRDVVVKRYPRDSFVLVDNFPQHICSSEKQVTPYFEDMFEHCGVGFIDYVFLHALSARGNERCEKLGVWDKAIELKNAGRIGHIGFSWHDSAENLDLVLSRHPEVSAVQIQANYADWEGRGGVKALCEVLDKYEVEVFVMEPVKGGLLASNLPGLGDIFKPINPDVSVASWALRFALGLPHVKCVFSGMNTMDQMRDNVKTALEWKPFTAEEEEALAKARVYIKESAGYQCTGCHYCEKRCPKAIPVCTMVSAVNDAVTFHLLGRGKHNYDFATSKEEHPGTGDPSECVKCGACEQMCPQHLPLISIVAKAYEIYGTGELALEQA